MKRISQINAEGLLVITTVVWGSTFFMIKLLLTDGSENSPFALLTARFIIATVLAFFLFTPKKFPDKTELIGGLIIGIAALCGYACQTVGLVYTTAAKSGFITSLFVIFVPFLSRIWEKKKIPINIYIALLPAALGLWAISGAGKSIMLINIGDKITLLSAISFAFQVVGIQVYTSKCSWKWLTILQFATVAAGSGIGLLFENPVVLSTTASNLLGITYLGIIASAGALGVQMFAQRFTTSARASFIYITEPIFAALFAWIFIGLGMNSIELLGTGAIFISIIIGRITSDTKGSDKNRQ